MNIQSLPCGNTDLIGLGENVYRYFDEKTSETYGFIGILNNEICFWSNKVTPVKYLDFILKDAMKYISKEKTPAKKPKSNKVAKKPEKVKTYGF